MHKEQMVLGKKLKKEGTEEESTEHEDRSLVNGLSLLPAKVEWCVLGLCSILFFCVPLFYLSLPKCHKCGNEPNLYYTASINDQFMEMNLCEDCARIPTVKNNLSKDKWKRTTLPPFELLARNIFSHPLRGIPDLFSVRTVNAEYKLAVFLGLASLLTGIVFCVLHLKKRLLCIPKPLLIFAGLFLGSVLLSSIFAHNFQRAWASSLLWHFVPVLFAFALAHVHWTRKKIAFCLGSLLIGGIASCLIAMDQHYKWNEWNWQGLVINPSVPASLIYNHNFAAEYHAPLLPIALGLIFYVRSIGFRIALGLVLAFVFLPTLVLSLARGAWVGLMGGCGLTSVSLLVAWLVWRKNNPKSSIQPKSFIPPGALLALGLALPLYIYTSNYWKKDAFSESAPSQTKTASKETSELKSITEISKADGGIQRRLVLWQDALLACLSTDLLLGKGTDHYELHFHESAKLSDQTTGGTLVRFVHNDFIQTLYENGLIGLIGFLGIWGWTLWRGLLSCLTRAKEADIPGLGLRVGLISASLVFLGEAFFEFPTRSPCALMVGWTTFGILLGILLQEKTSPDRSSEKSIFQQGPRLNFALGAIGVLVIPYGCLLAKDLFWTNVYHVQGRVAGDYGKKDKSLNFHRKAISYAPWEHHSRKFECYYLLTHTKQIPQAIEAIEQTLEVHPGCLVAHRNKIAVYLNSGQVNEARKAHLEMKMAAPFHPYTANEGKRIPTQK
jgi:O-antigen ligase